MTETNTTTPATSTPRTQADLPPLEFLEYLIAEAQQAARAVQHYAGKPEMDGEVSFDVLTQVGPAMRFLDAAMGALAAHQPAPELPSGVDVGEG